MSDQPKPLIDRLKEAAEGRDEWRVQDPETGAYCMAFSRHDGKSFAPEREARAWLADHQKRFPHSTHARYVVACVKVQTYEQRLMDEAAEAHKDLLAKHNNLHRSAANDRAESDRLRPLTFCLCGDQFSLHDPGTCGACVAGADKMSELERLRSALQEADTLMGHEDQYTEWRERWAHLWPATPTATPQR